MAEPMLIAVDKARATVAAVFERAGLPPEDAAILRDALIDAELTGRKGHGLIRIPSLVKQAAGRGSANIHVSRDAGHLVALDGGDALGYLAAYRAAQEVIERLGRLPLVAVGCRNTRHCGALGYYARLVTMKGHFALALANCCPLLAPHGATRAVFGTNPIALACPGPDHPLVADLSPGAITYGAVMNAQQSGLPLPEGVAIDAAGLPTTAPEAAQEGAILAVGGPKGSALAFLVQVLAGVLCGGAPVPADYVDYGFLLVGFRSDAFAPAARVHESMAALVEAVHAADAQCPGERSENRRQAGLAEGIEADAVLWRELQSLAGDTADGS